MKTVLALAFILILAGCSTPPMSDRQVEAMNRPTITLDCTTGCQATYTDPRDRPSMPTNGWDVGITAINAAAGVVSSTAPWAAIGITAAEGIKNAVGDDNSSRSVDSSVQTADNSSRSSDDNSVRTDDRAYDNSVRDNRTYDSTHKPTVITQPDPVIVNQPAPSSDTNK